MYANILLLSKIRIASQYIYYLTCTEKRCRNARIGIIRKEFNSTILNSPFYVVPLYRRLYHRDLHTFARKRHEYAKMLHGCTEKLCEPLHANTTCPKYRRSPSKSPLTARTTPSSLFLPRPVPHSPTLFRVFLRPACYHGPLSFAQWPLLFSTARVAFSGELANP